MVAYYLFRSPDFPVHEVRALTTHFQKVPGTLMRVGIAPNFVWWIMPFRILNNCHQHRARWVRMNHTVIHTNPAYEKSGFQWVHSWNGYQPNTLGIMSTDLVERCFMVIRFSTVLTLLRGVSEKGKMHRSIDFVVGDAWAWTLDDPVSNVGTLFMALIWMQTKGTNEGEKTNKTKKKDRGKNWEKQIINGELLRKRNMSRLKQSEHFSISTVYLNGAIVTIRGMYLLDFCRLNITPMKRSEWYRTRTPIMLQNFAIDTAAHRRRNIFDWS